MESAYARRWCPDLRVVPAAIGVARRLDEPGEAAEILVIERNPGRLLSCGLFFLLGQLSNQWPLIKGLAPFSGIDRPALWFVRKPDRHASIRCSGELRIDGFGNPDGCSRLPNEQSRQQHEYCTEANADRSAAAWQMSFFLPGQLIPQS
jgi:hypothetical protein